MSAMDDAHDPVVDRLGIQDWFTSYAACVDGKRWTEWRSLFTADAQIDYSSAGGPVGDRDVVAGGLDAALAHFPMTQHYMHRADRALYQAKRSVRGGWVTAQDN